LSHLNVRDKTGAPEGAWQRAVDTVGRARRSGLDVLMDTTPCLEGLGMMAGLLPAWHAARVTPAQQLKTL